MARLVEVLRTSGQEAELIEDVSAMRWRVMAGAGTVGRIRARLGAMVRFPLKAMGKAFSPHAGVLVPTTNPFFVPVLLVATKALHGRPVVPLIYDLYPDAIEAAGDGQTSTLTSGLGVILNRFLFAHADSMVFIGHRMKTHAIRRYGTPRSSKVIHTGASVEEFSGPEFDKLKFASNLSESSSSSIEVNSSVQTVCGVDIIDKLVISYVGNLGHVHEWETLKEGLAHLCRAQPKDLVVIFAASGPGVDYLKSELPPGYSSLIHFVGPADDAEWRRLLAATDVSLVSLRTQAIHTSVPSKTFSAMAASSAIIAVAPKGSDLADVVTQADCGMVVSPGNPLQFLDALLELSRDRKELQRLKTNAVDAIEADYSLKVLAEKWKTVVADAATGGHSGFGYEVVKRGVDIAIAGTALIVLSPVLAGAAVAVRLSMGSPLLFQQQRPGLGGKLFNLYKFRSMRTARPDESGPEYDAVRMTRVGKFLRASSIDELPALFNVLRGDMSLVGPRPLLARYLGRYSERQARRHRVVPGITGLAQVRGRNAISWNEKFEHDIEYVEGRGLWLDFMILVETALKVIRRSDISQDGHATMPEFRGGSTGTE